MDRFFDFLDKHGWKVWIAGVIIALLVMGVGLWLGLELIDWLQRN